MKPILSSRIGFTTFLLEKQMGKSKKLLQRGERGFTLIELLIVAMILGIIAGVIVPNIVGFLNTANIAAANSEENAVRTAADASYSDTGSWPADSSNLASDGFLDREPKEIYSFDTDGLIDGIDSSGGWIEAGLSFNTTSQQWE